MSRGSQHPFGCQIKAGNRIKLRMVNLIHTYDACYADMWNAGWTTTRMTAMINAAVSVGANSVKLFCSGLAETAYDGGAQQIAGTPPGDAVLRGRLQWTFQQLRNAGLKMYFGVGPTPAILVGNGTAATIAANLAITQKIIQWVLADAPDLLVAFELCNEINEVVPSAWPTAGNRNTLDAAQKAFMVQLVNAARAAAQAMGVYVPMSFSVYVQTLNELATSPHIGLQKSLGMDFHDYHPYWQIINYTPTVITPQGSDLASLRNRSDFIGLSIMGENGCGQTYSDGSVTPPAFQKLWTDGLGDHCRQPDSLGGNFFVIFDYHSADTNNFGMFDKNGLNPRPGVIAPFGNWPASL